MRYRMDSYNELISQLDRKNRLENQESFTLATQCANLLLGNETDIALARKIIIHVLNILPQISESTYTIWADMVEAVGFYPYLEKNNQSMKLQSLSAEIRQKASLSDYLPNTYLHEDQRKLSKLLLSGQNVIASAPTSFGKSLLIEELIASQKYRNIVVIQPTLALLDETRLKLKKYSNYYKIIVRTSQQPSEEKGNLFLLTAERVMEYNPLPTIDLLIIDEFYKLSLRRIDERADILNNAFLKIVNKFHSKFYFLGPNIDGITPGFAQKYNAVFYKSNFSLVDCHVVDLSSSFDKGTSQRTLDKQKMVQLCALLDQLENEQTLVYCATPARARRFAKEYLEYLRMRGVQPNTQLPLIDWINKNVNRNWSLSNELKYGIAIHDGSLQKHIGASIINYFNTGQLRCIFCTSTIIEGVNTSAKNVVIFDNKKGGKDIDFFDYSNIVGRSGRMMEHYIGNIYNFVPIPQEEKTIIDIPFFEQDKDILTDEILVNIEKQDVQRQVLARYNKLNEIQPALMDIIKKNGTNINGQMNIYYALERDVRTAQYANIAWTQMPSWDNLIYILGLAENNVFDFNGEHMIRSSKQLARYVHMYRKHQHIMSIVKDIYLSKIKQLKAPTYSQKLLHLDNAIESGFHLYRRWFLFTVPKAFRVIDSLQRYVCAEHGKKAGSYSYFVQQLENDFVRENLSILVEYGVPSDTVRKIEQQIPSNLDEDGVIGYIKSNKNSIYNSLSQYEVDRLNFAL